MLAGVCFLIPFIFHQSSNVNGGCGFGAELICVIAGSLCLSARSLQRRQPCRAAATRTGRNELNYCGSSVGDFGGGGAGNWGMSRRGLICCSRESKGQNKGKNTLGASSDLCLIGERELNKGATALPPTSPALPCSMFPCLSEASVRSEHLRQAPFLTRN